MNTLNYSFVRTEADAKIALFLFCENEWLNEEIDLDVNPNQTLTLSVPNKGIFTTKILEPILYSHLMKEDTIIVFSDHDSNMLGQIVAPPFNKK